MINADLTQRVFANFVHVSEKRVFITMTSGLEEIQNLFKFLCENTVSGSEEEIYQYWLSQYNEIPSIEILPMCFQMIRNMKKSTVPKDLIRKCGKMFY